MDGPPSCLRGCADIDELPARRNKSLRWTALETECLSEGCSGTNGLFAEGLAGALG